MWQHIAAGSAIEASAISSPGGLLAFATPEEALECIERVNADYRAHCSAARRLVDDFLQFPTLLSPLVAAALSA